MSRFLIQRAGQALLLFFLLSSLVFVLFAMIPGDYLAEMEVSASVSTEQIEQLRRQFGLDQPFYRQYLMWLKTLASGNLGYSFAQQRPAVGLITERMGNTLLLAGGSFFLSLLLAFPIGVASALYSGRWPDRLGTIFSLVGLSFPSLLLSLFGIYFAFRTQWFPVGGMGSFRHWILPSLVLSLPAAAYRFEQVSLM